jgi:hypothetical protein
MSSRLINSTKKYSSKKISKKPVKDFKPIPEVINPNPITNTQQNTQQNKPKIEDIKIPKTAGLPAFKIQFPTKEIMVPTPAPK